MHWLLKVYPQKSEHYYIKKLKDTLDLCFGDEHFVLHKDKAMYWQEEDCLLLADIHAGKAEHFRKHGIPISTDSLLQDLNRIESLLDFFETRKMVVLGDLFHSLPNAENAFVAHWISEQNIDFLLVAGNHDRYSSTDHSLKSTERLSVRKLILSHEAEEGKEGEFRISGHLHPSFRLKGKARQSLHFPCFYMSNKSLILPAFGRLTGSHCLSKGAKDHITLCTPEGLLIV